MVGHEVLHHRACLARVGTGVVQRVAESVRPERAPAFQRPHVAQRARRLDHRRQCRGVGGDDQVGVQAALERQVGHPEGPVLVGPEAIADVVGALARSPWHRVASPVGNLTPHCAPVGLIEERLREGAHQEQGHQVLEHRPAPGHQSGLSGGARQLPSEMEPVVDRDVVLGDRHVAGQPRLGGQEVVVRGVQRVAGELVSDGEERPLPVVEEAEVHRVRVAARGGGQRLQASDQLRGPWAGRGERAERGEDPGRRSEPTHAGDRLEAFHPAALLGDEAARPGGPLRAQLRVACAARPPRRRPAPAPRAAPARRRGQPRHR